MLRISLFVAFIMGLLSTTALGFDNQRKGFIFGAGLGIHGNSYESILRADNSPSVQKSKTEIGLFSDMKIGVAPTDRLEFYYTVKTSWIPITNDVNERVRVANQLGAIGFSYFLSDELDVYEWDRSFFVSCGIGSAAWSMVRGNGNDTQFGYGYFIGVGYEPTRHMRIELNLVSTATSDSGMDSNGNWNSDIDTKFVTLGITSMAF